jgi:hypothetical protein
MPGAKGTDSEWVSPVRPIESQCIAYLEGVCAPLAQEHLECLLELKCNDPQSCISGVQA